MTIANYSPTNEDGFTFSFAVVGQPTATDFIYDVQNGTERFFINFTAAGSLQITRQSASGGKIITSPSTIAYFTGKSIDEINIIELEFVGTNLKITWNGYDPVNITIDNPLDLSDFGAVDTYLMNRNDLARAYTAKLIYFAIRKGVHSIKKLKRIYKNSFINSNIGNWDLFYTSNLSSYSENGVDVFNANLGSLGGTFDAKQLGLIGATSADRLADVPNHLIDINDLR